MPGQQALGRGLVVGQAEREQHTVLDQRGGRTRLERHGGVQQGDEGGHREPQRGEKPARGPYAVPGGEHRRQDRDREPGGGLQVAGDTEGDPRAHDPRRGGPGSRGSGAQGQRQQHEREHGRVGGDHGQVEADHRRGDRDRGGQQGVVAEGRHRDAEGCREHGYGTQSQPHPGVPGQAADASRSWRPNTVMTGK